MQVEELGIKLNITAQQLKNLLRIGEKLEAIVISKKGDFKYILRIKGQLFEATSTIPINSNRIKVQVKSISPQLILKILTDTTQAHPSNEQIIQDKYITEQIKNLSVFEEGAVEAELLNKTTDDTYTFNIKGKIIQIKLQKPLQSPFVKIFVEENGNIRIAEEKYIPINFSKDSSSIFINIPEKLAEEAATKLLKALSENDRLSLIQSIVKLKNAIKNPEIEKLIAETEEKLIKERKIEPKLIEKLAEKLMTVSSDKEKTVKHVSDLLKDTLKQFGNLKLQSGQENLFAFLPFIINGKEEKVYLKKEELPSNKGKKAFKITLILNSSSYGSILINALSIEKSVSLSLFFTTKKAFERFKSQQDEIKKILGDVNLYIGLTEAKPLINHRQINLKI